MKKILGTSIAFLLFFLTAISFSSCTFFKTIRENAAKAEQMTIYETPEKAEILSTFNSLIELSVKNAAEIKENVSYSADTPKITKNGEDAGILNSGAKQLKDFIMAGKPGKESRILENGAQDTLLKAINSAYVLESGCERNITSENVTDAKGHEVTNDKGKIETTRYIGDNIAHFAIKYFEVLNTDGSPYENKDNKGEEISTTVVHADNAAIEAVFGMQKDKQTVIKNFECISDYLKVKDYKIKYENCFINSDADLETQRLFFVKFTKNMTVTAKAEGVGKLSEYGEMEIVFSLSQSTNYEFKYNEEEALAD